MGVQLCCLDESISVSCIITHVPCFVMCVFMYVLIYVGEYTVHVCYSILDLEWLSQGLFSASLHFINCSCPVTVSFHALNSIQMAISRVNSNIHVWKENTAVQIKSCEICIFICELHFFTLLAFSRELQSSRENKHVTRNNGIGYLFLLSCYKWDILIHHMIFKKRHFPFCMLLWMIMKCQM